MRLPVTGPRPPRSRRGTTPADMWALARPLVGRCLIAGLCLVSVTCSSGTEPGDPPPGSPGVVTYGLHSPNELEGALLFTAPADQVLSVPEGDAVTEVVTYEAGALLYVAVVHRLGLGTLAFDLEVADASAPPELTLLAVVGADDEQRSLDGMALVVLP